MDANTPKEPEIDIEKFDLLSVYNGVDIGTIDDETLLKIIIKLQEMRKIRIKKTKRKTPLDKLINEMDITKARIYLDVFKNQ